MPILDHWELQLTIDQVLRAQGADPEIILARQPNLVKTTQEAITWGQSLLQPTVLYEKYVVSGLTHERLDLVPHDSDHGKYRLSVPLIAQNMARANEIMVMLCTIGSGLDDSVSSLFNIDPMLALALDGVGSAAVEMLTIKACNYFEREVKNDGLYTTMPLNPGMVGWPLDIGQQQIFSLLDGEEINVSLPDSWMMVPNKSLSLVMGIGPNVSAYETSCEYCSLKGICKYQNHYAK